MRINWLQMILRAPDGEGAGAGGEGGDDLFSQGKGSDAGKAADADAGKGAGADNGKGQEGAKSYRPEGVPENLFGDTDQATIDLMAKAIKGFQADKSNAGRMGSAPENADGYTFEATGDDDELHALLTGDRLKDVVGHARAAALEAGMSTRQFDKFMRHYAANGIDPLELMSDEHATIASGKAERAALDEMTGDPAVSQGILDLVVGKGTFLKNAGVLTAEDLDEYRIMCGTAEGMSVMHKVIGALTGEKAVPVVPGLQGGAMALPQAQAALHAAMALKPNDPNREQAILDAERKIEAAVAAGAKRQ